MVFSFNKGSHFICSSKGPEYSTRAGKKKVDLNIVKSKSQHKIRHWTNAEGEKVAVSLTTYSEKMNPSQFHFFVTNNTVRAGGLLPLWPEDSSYHAPLGPEIWSGRDKLLDPGPDCGLPPDQVNQLPLRGLMPPGWREVVEESGSWKTCLRRH